MSKRARTDLDQLLDAIDDNAVTPWTIMEGLWLFALSLVPLWLIYTVLANVKW